MGVSQLVAVTVTKCMVLGGPPTRQTTLGRQADAHPCGRCRCVGTSPPHRLSKQLRVCCCGCT